MKRVVTISWFLLVFCFSSYGQLGRIDGELRYGQYYQDFDLGGNLTSNLIRDPAIDLRMRGSILSPQLLFYSFFSSLNANYVTTNSPFFKYSSSQYSWNKYNLILNVLPYAPVKLTLAARENSVEIKSGGDFASDHTSNRQQEQRADLSVHQISWLPTLNLAWVRTRSFSDVGIPYDIANQTLTFVASGATDTTGSYSLATSLIDMRDRIGGGYDRFFTMQFSGTKAMSNRHVVTINSEYEKYVGSSVLGGSVAYSGIITNRFRVGTGVSASSTLSAYTQSRSVSVSQSGSYRINDNLQCGIGLGGFLTNSKILTINGGLSNVYKSWSSSGNVHYSRSIANMNFQNTISLGYGQQLYADRYQTITGGVSSSVSRPLGNFLLSGNYNLSYVHLKNSISTETIDNTASITVSGVLPRQIQSQSDLRFRDSHNVGDETPYLTQRDLSFSQLFSGSFVYTIPFNLSLSISSNWYLSGLIGRTYGWTMSFASPSFFLNGLFVTYVYSRSYDRYYLREIPEHNGSMSYRWRAISFTSRFRYTTFPIRVREISFVITRPF
jgi:hypothetical protein